MSPSAASAVPNDPRSSFLTDATPIRNKNEDDNAWLCNKFGAMMKTGDKLSEESHAVTYSLIWRGTSKVIDGLKARVYDLNGIPYEFKRYRTRSMKRWLNMDLSAIKAKRGKSSVIVYFTDEERRPPWLKRVLERETKLQGQKIYDLWFEFNEKRLKQGRFDETEPRVQFIKYALERDASLKDYLERTVKAPIMKALGRAPPG